MNAPALVPPNVSHAVPGTGWINATIAIGCIMFVLGLTISAVFAPEWRVLHVFQALIYVVVVVMTRRKMAAGFGAGLSVPLFWNALVVFTGPARECIQELATLLRTGHAQHPDLLLTLFAACGHVLMILGCIVGFLRLRPAARQWTQLLVGGVAALSYLIAIVFLFGPPQAVELMKHVLHI